MSVNDVSPRRITFDPTINLGHIITAAIFFASAVTAYVSVQARLDLNERETTRIERQMKDDLSRAEKRFDEDQRRDREAFTEIKVLLRDISTKLDQKQDKPR